MTLSEDRVVLAVECGACQQLTAVPTYDGAQHIARCGNCGGRFHAAEQLISQYQTSAERLARYDTLMHALQEVQQAMTAALEQWGCKAGKDLLRRALSAAEARAQAG